MFLSQVCLRSGPYFAVQTEPKILRLVVRTKLTQSDFRLRHLAEETEVTILGEASQEFSSGQDDRLPAQEQLQLQHLRPRHDRVQACRAGVSPVTRQDKN